MLPAGTDAAGRTGVVLSQISQDGEKAERFFDPETFTYLGLRSSDARSGDLRHGSAVVRTTIVARTGRLP